MRCLNINKGSSLITAKKIKWGKLNGPPCMLKKMIIIKLYKRLNVQKIVKIIMMNIVINYIQTD